MIAGKIKFLPETASTLRSHHAPAPGLAQPGSSTMPTQSSQARTSSTVQAIAERTSVGLPPLKMVLTHTENERRNNASKNVIRWHYTKDEIDVEMIVHRIIDHLNKES